MQRKYNPVDGTEKCSSKMPDEVGNVSKSRSALINSRRASWKSVEPVGKSEEDGHREKSIAWVRIYALLRKEKKKKLYRLKKKEKGKGNETL